MPHTYVLADRLMLPAHLCRACYTDIPSKYIYIAWPKIATDETSSPNDAGSDLSLAISIYTTLSIASVMHVCISAFLHCSSASILDLFSHVKMRVFLHVWFSAVSGIAKRNKKRLSASDVHRCCFLMSLPFLYSLRYSISTPKESIYRQCRLHGILYMQH